jgi:hypothetical protein
MTIISVTNNDPIHSLRIARVWDMPTSRPFINSTPIMNLIEEEIRGFSPEEIIEPFPYRAKIDASEYIRGFTSASKSVCLLDPPYSKRQAKDLYEKEKPQFKMVSWQSPKEYWSEFMGEVARVLRPGGKCISLGWNSQGVGKGLGFEIIRILLVSHGGWRNDTIVTVDRNMFGVLL